MLLKSLKFNGTLSTSCRGNETSHVFEPVEVRQISPIVEMTVQTIYNESNNTTL